MGSNVLYYRLLANSKIEIEETYFVFGNSIMSEQNMKKKQQSKKVGNQDTHYLLLGTSWS
jgi:hypothetical protein